MRKVMGISLLLVVALTAMAFGKPVDQFDSRRAEIPVYGEDMSRSSGTFNLSTHVFVDTTVYGGTWWAADSLRWEALKDSCWTFDTGVGSSINTGANPNKPVGYHQTMEGWFGIDQTLSPLPYFRRTSLCAITAGGSTMSFWAGVSLAEANALCFADGQGYGNAWTLFLEKTYAYGGVGNVTFEYDIAIDAEPGFDFTRVNVIQDDGTTETELTNYTGAVGSQAAPVHDSFTVLPAQLGPGPTVTFQFLVESDGSYSDEDGLWPTTCGHTAVDNVSLSGAIVDFSDFEAGPNGWAQNIPTTGVGDFSTLKDRNLDLPPPVAFCQCDMVDTVLVFSNLLDLHTLDQDNIAACPWIDLRRGGDDGRPGKLIIYSGYFEMPLFNYIYVQIRARWYPSVCDATGLIFRTPFRDQNIVFYFGEAPFCNGPRRLGNFPISREYGGLIEPGAEQVQIALGMLNLCSTAPFGGPCSGVTNTTPWIDNVYLGVWGPRTAPLVQLITFDRLQDNWAEDGTPRVDSTVRVDTNTLKNASTPGPGSIMRDTLVARGDGGNTEVRLYLSIERLGPFVNAARYAAWLARLTPAPSIGPGWYCARMDSAEQAGAIAGGQPGWMSTFHEADPGFMGTDSTPDPLDPNQLENEILCDKVFTPGTRINYFLAARYIPPDPRNVGGTNWFIEPDTTGENWREWEALPSSMAADSTWNCTLYVDHHQDRSFLEQGLEEEGLQVALPLGGATAEGTGYDRYDVETPSSGQLSFGRPIQTNYGSSITQTFDYRCIVWHCAGLSSLQLTDEDANMLGPWLTLISGGGGNRLWVSGDGAARSMNTSGEIPTINFMRNVMGNIAACNTIRDPGCPSGAVLDSTYCIPMVNIAGQHFATTVATSGRGNGCFDVRSFDLNQRNTAVATALGQLNYIKSGVPVPPSGAATRGMSISNHNVIDIDYKTVLDGAAVGALRTTPASPNVVSLCTDVGAAISRTTDVLGWFQSALICRVRPQIQDIPGFESPKPPQFRTSLGNAYPNPMNPTTRIQFTNGVENGRVTLHIFDVTGRLVKTLVDANMPAGVHEVTWDGTAGDGSSASSGMYFYRMTGDSKDGKYVSSKKLVMMK